MLLWTKLERLCCIVTIHLPREQSSAQLGLDEELRIVQERRRIEGSSWNSSVDLIGSGYSVPIHTTVVNL